VGGRDRRTRTIRVFADPEQHRISAGQRLSLCGTIVSSAMNLCKLTGFGRDGGMAADLDGLLQ
jgi:hypothetical protein